ncbi:MAG: aminodeoxychorismate/anthranilate synthase component II [Candidatus Gracilibacteria bacterium]|jgi:anthranilate synthase/aminodeoxychorismate synthase-like glutamine amidotransferase
MRLILIDNYDSFTYNLYQQICRLGGLRSASQDFALDVDVRKHDEISINDVRDYDAIVISPGPKKPSDSGISREVIAKFYDKKPILGVCLGHQCIGEVFGAKTIRAQKVMHGKTSSISHNGRGVFKGIKSPFKAARYHSLIIDRVPDEFELTAWTGEKIIMGITHEKHPVYGVQFHPESFLTNNEFSSGKQLDLKGRRSKTPSAPGDKLISNFLNEIASRKN